MQIRLFNLATSNDNKRELNLSVAFTLAVSTHKGSETREYGRARI